MDDRVEGYLLSPQQRRLWTLWSQSPAAYRSQSAVLLRGELSMAELQRAVNAAVQRHDGLRTVFHRRRGMAMPLQVVADRGAVSWREVCAGADPRARSVVFDDVLAAELRRDFMPAEQPLLYAATVHLGAGETLLVLTLPALAADLATHAVLLAEICADYQSRLRGASREWDEPLQYPQFAQWQNDLLSDDLAAQGAAFWQESVEGLAGAPRLLHESSSQEQSPFVPGWIELEIAPKLAAGIDRLAQTQGVMAETVLFAAWQALVHRLAGRRDFAVQVVVDCRDHESLQGAVGPLAKAVPVGCRLGGDESLVEIIARTAAALAAATEWQHHFAPSGGVQAREEGPADLTIGFDARVWREPLLEPGLSVELLRGRSCMEPWKLHLSCVRTAGRWQAGLQFDPRRFTGAAAERIAASFHELLYRALLHPGLPVDSLALPILDDLFGTAISTGSAGTDEPVRPVHELVAARAARVPQRIAVQAGEQSLTYAELEARANRLGHLLRRRGVGSGTLVAVCLERSLDLLPALLGILKAGAAYVALDPEYPRERLALILEQEPPRLILTSQGLAPLLPASVPRLFLDADHDQLDAEPVTAPMVEITDADLAYVLFTSGSTGRPKGVMVTHGGLANYLVWCGAAYETAGGSGAPVHSSVGFDLTVTGLYAPLLAGETVHLVPEEEGIESLAQTLRSGHRFSFLKVTPAHLEVLQAMAPEAASSLDALIVGGDALFGESLSHWRTRAPGLRIFNEYGPTETVVGCCVYEVPAGDTGTGPIRIGRPIANTRVHLLNRYLLPVPPGAVGELCVGGAGVARGYLRAPELTAERFIPDPSAVQPGARLYRTGDRARLLADGNFEFLGRDDRQVKVRGTRIELDEIEGALLRHPQMISAAVVVRDDPRELVAYVVTRQPILAREMRDHLARIVPEAMIPAQLVSLPELPLTAHGKVDRKQLPDPESLRATGSHVPPRSPVEGRLVSLWEEVLKRRSVGVTDNFFDLGGDSIKAVRLVSRVNDELGVNLQVPDLFKYQSVAALYDNLAATAGRSSLWEQHDVGQAQIAAMRAAIETEHRRLLPSGYESLYPLSGIEKGMVYYTLLMPDEPVYHDQAAYLLDVADTGRFFAAFNLLIERHEALRSAYYLYSFPTPLKVVLPAARLPESIEDLTELPVEEQKRVIEEYRQGDLAAPFRFDGELLWRTRLFRLDGSLHCLVWTWHHAILDGWSNHSFWVELNELCNRPRLDPSAALPRLASRYEDYVAITLGRGSDAGVEAFWRRALAGSTRNKLPFGRSGPRRGGERGMRTRELLLGQELLDRLRLRALELHVPMQALCLSAHLYLLHVIAGEADVMCGLVCHDRPALKDGDRILGCFLNSIPMRLDVTAFASGAALVRAVADRIAEQKQFEIPLVDIAALVGSRDTGDNPLFDVLFNFMDFHVVEEIERNLIFSPMSDEAVRSIYGFRSYEMTNTLFDVEVSTTLDRFFVRIKYSPRLFSEDEITTALELYQRLLVHLADDLDGRPDLWDLVGEADRRELVTVFNDTSRPVAGVCIHELIAERAVRQPSDIAVRCGDLQWTYGELERHANLLAKRLRELGVKPGESVGLLFERSLELVSGMLAVLTAGAAYVPIEPDYPAARKAYIVESSRLAWILSDRIYGLGECQAPVGFVVVEPEPQDGPRSPDAEKGAAPPAVAPDSLAYTIYTSGSTGHPKGVMISHRSAVNLMDWVTRTYGVDSGSRLLMVSSICFDLSVYDLCGGLAAGAQVVVARTADLRDPMRLARLVSDERITFWNSVPSTMTHLVSYLEAEEPDYRQHVLKVIFLSGDWIPLGLAARAVRFFPQARVVSLGGATEATVWSNFHDIAGLDPEWVSVPYGRPIQNTSFYILDAGLRPVPAGVVGGLFIGGTGVAMGYVNDPVKTANAFLPDPFAGIPGTRMYRTGDLGRMLPGLEMEFLGRSDHQVKIRGYRVELGEVEAQLGTHPEVQQAVVIAHPERGSDRQLCAYVAGQPGLQAADLRQFLAGRLPEYMIPGPFIFLPALPLTPNGKVDRRALPAPGLDNISTSTEYVEPEGPVEAALAAIWEEVLGVEGIGSRHDFFEVGGHSLSAVQVVSRIRQRLGVVLSLRDFFTASTVAGVAATVDRLSAAGTAAENEAAAIRALPRQLPATVPLSFSQERLWFFHQLNPLSTAFHLGGALRLAGRLDVPALAASLDEVCRRQGALRTRFAEIGGLPFQVIDEPAAQSLPVIDLAGLPRARRQGALDFVAREVGDRPFDLAWGRLLRSVLIRLEAAEHVGVFILHHIVADGWSVGLLLREVGELYDRLTSGSAPALPPLPIQYADYVEWQRASLQGERLERQLSFWRSQLGGSLPRLELPMQRQRGTIPSLRGSTHRRKLSPRLSRSLEQLAHRQGATLFMTLLAAFKALLHLYTGQEDVIVGTTVANRTWPETEDVIGLFVNNLALRTDLSGGPRFVDLLGRVREVALAAFAHQDVPLERVLEDLQPQRISAFAPLFQVMFVLQNFPAAARELPGLSLSAVELPRVTASFDLVLMATEEPDGLAMVFAYDTELFDMATISRMADHLEALLVAVAREPERQITTFSWTSSDEARACVGSFNEDD